MPMTAQDALDVLHAAYRLCRTIDRTMGRPNKDDPLSGAEKRVVAKLIEDRQVQKALGRLPEEQHQEALDLLDELREYLECEPSYESWAEHRMREAAERSGKDRRSEAAALDPLNVLSSPPVPKKRKQERLRPGTVLLWDLLPAV